MSLRWMNSSRDSVCAAVGSMPSMEKKFSVTKTSSESDLISKPANSTLAMFMMLRKRVEDSRTS